MSEGNRSALPEVRNPLLRASDRARHLLAALPPESRQALLAIALELRDLFREDAEHAWKKRKGPLALYNRWAATYLTHLVRLLRKPAFSRTR